MRWPTLRPEPEAALVERTLKRLKAAGYLTCHISDSRMIVNRHGRFEVVADPECAGFSDIFAVNRVTGHMVAIECKRPGEHPRPNQVEWLETLALAGADTYTMTVLNEAAVMGAVLGERELVHA